MVDDFDGDAADYYYDLYVDRLMEGLPVREVKVSKAQFMSDPYKHLGLNRVTCADGSTEDVSDEELEAAGEVFDRQGRAE